MKGQLKEEMSEIDFLMRLKAAFGLKVLKHTRLRDKPVRNVAVCGGSGRFLLKNVIAAGADVFITSDFKYHEYFDADGKILLADIGHFESEQFTPEIFYEIIKKKFPTFAIHLSKTATNPINYL
jgi:putative NIF3 family GTP cyclohydrolase 1 type 2